MNSWTSPVDIRPDHLAIVQDILRTHLPAGFKVWVFGSRANWTTKDSSDLDLAVEGAAKLDHKAMVGLEVAFEESDLPYTVDVVDLKAVSSGFRQIVEDQRVLLTGAGSGANVHSEWREGTLGGVIEFKRGYDLPQRDRNPGSVPLVSSSGVTDFHAEAKVKGPGVVTGRYGTLGEVFFIQEDFWPLNTTLYVRDFKGNDPRFISYFLRSLDFSAYSDKAAVPGLNRNHLHEATVRYPTDIGQQRAIAHVLGTLDDKIELNRRMNQTLEEMARTLFQDWFVDFGPTRAKMEGLEPYLFPELWGLFPDKLVDSELGEIPDGWKVGALSDYASLNQESWSKKTLPNEIEYVDLANTKWGTIESTQHFSGEAAPSRARRVLRPGDTIVGTVRPGNGSFSLVGRNGLTGSTGFAVLRPLRHWFRELVYLAATDPDNIERLTHRADGGAYPAVRPEVVAESQVVTPNEGTISLDHFSNAIRPLLDKMEKNRAEIRMLATLRDELLPSLISGELNPAGD